MKIKYTWRYCLAFMAFVFVFGQLHEISHLTTAYFICGCPGKQVDFNLWTVCDSCNTNPWAYLATIFGPLFSVALMWAGYFMLRHANTRRYNLAFVLIMGNLAFARILTAAMGGGDEKTVLRIWLPHEPLLLVKALAFMIVFALCFPPLCMVYKKLLNKNKLLVMAGFCIVPLCIMMPYEFILLGKVLKAGFMAHTRFLGVADFIYLHTLLMVIILLLMRKVLFTLHYPIESSVKNANLLFHKKLC